MSTGRGRSWRPEKRRRVGGERRQQIIFIAVMLLLLIAGAAYLVLGPKVPSLHFVTILETEFGQDSSGMLIVPEPAAETNAVRLSRLLEAIHIKNPTLVATPEPVRSLAGFQTGLQLQPREKLMIYLCAETRIVPDDTAQGSPVLELLPGRQGTAPVRFRALLQSLKALQASQIIVLFEPSRRRRGFINGALSDDLIPVISKEIESAELPGLTVICSHSSGERSWEYPLSQSDTVQQPAADVARNMAATPPVIFQGTVFGHFIEQAILDGRASSTAELQQYLQTAVADWVRLNVGEEQTVVMFTSGKGTADRELFARASLPSADELLRLQPGGADTVVVSDTAEAQPKSDGQPSSAVETKDEHSPADKLAQLTAERNQLAEQGLAAAVFPVEWNRLQSSLLAAEACLQHQQTADFGRIHDQHLVPEMRKLTDQTQRLLSPADRQEQVRWLSPAKIPSEADRSLFRQALESVSTADASLIPRLPAELRVEGRSRRAFVTWLLDDLSDLAEKLSGLPPEEQQKRVQQRVTFLQTLEQAGWSLEDSPHQIAALRDVLTGDDTAWHIAALETAVRLVRLREQALQLASGISGDGYPLRSSLWKQHRMAFAQVLAALTAAERWLAAGPAGQQLAKDRLATAAGQLQQILADTQFQHQLAIIGDSQWHEVLWMIQFLASQQEQIVLSPEELESAVRMASAVVDRNDPESDFPTGQLDSIDLRRDHLTAMFAMSRDFKETPLNEADTLRYQLLRSYVQERGLRQTSAAEKLRILEIPTLPQREKLFSAVLNGQSAGRGQNSSGLSRSGLWLSFWSIRLLDAVTDDSIDCSPLWRQWKVFVELLAGADQQAIMKARTVLAADLRQAWGNAFRQRLQRPANGIFASAEDVNPLIAEDVQRRLDASGNRLYAEIYRQLTGSRPVSAVASLQPQRTAIELDAENRTQLNLSTPGVRQLYVLQGDIRVVNPGVQIERNWQRLDLTDSASPLTSILLQANAPIREPVSVQLAAVNEFNTVVALQAVMVHPGSQTDWDVELIRPDGQLMTLIRTGARENLNQRRLTLLPGTTDMLTGMDTPVPLRVRLRRSSGAAVRASLQLYNLIDNSAVWAAPRMIELDPQSGTAEISLAEPLAAAPAAVTIPGVTESKSTGINFSNGFRFEITPQDVLQKSTSRIEVSIVFSEPEQFVQRPRPVYDHETNSLTIPLERASIEDPAVLLPAKIPIEAYFNPQLRSYLLPGGVTTAPNLPADGITLRYQFAQEIVSADPAQKLEFGLSVAGIPNPWRWRLTDADPALVGDGDTRSVRVHLEVANVAEVKPVTEMPELLIGEAWQNARLKAEMFLYGGRFDDSSWQLQLGIRNRDLDRRSPAVDAPIVLRRRYSEHVTVSPGENGSWLFSTRTSPWSRTDLNLRQYGLSDGRYELLASVEQTGAGVGGALIEDGTQFIVDSTPPIVLDDRIRIPDRVPIDRVLRGTVEVEDAESGIASVRIGLDPAMLQPVLLAGDESRPSGAFEIQPSQGFPMLEQRETDHAREVTLHLEVTNRAGILKLFRKPVTFFRKGIPAKPMAENRGPGSLEVTFNSGTKYVVAISGPEGTAETKTEAMVVLFPMLPPGQYTIEWKTAGQGLNKGSAVATVTSGRKTTVVGRK